VDATTKLLPNGSKVYQLHGPLFFGSITSFKELFDPKGDPDDVVIDFVESRVWDHSGLEAIDALAERYLKAGKQLHLRHLSPDCKVLLEKAGDMVEINVIEDPLYGLVIDYPKEAQDEISDHITPTKPIDA